MSFPPGTEMFQFPRFASKPYVFRLGYPIQGGLPHSDTPGSKLARSSPRIFAACHVLHRLLVPRHPPDALLSLKHRAPRARPKPNPRSPSTTMHRNNQRAGVSPERQPCQNTAHTLIYSAHSNAPEPCSAFPCGFHPLLTEATVTGSDNSHANTPRTPRTTPNPTPTQRQEPAGATRVVLRAQERTRTRFTLSQRPTRHDKPTHPATAVARRHPHRSRTTTTTSPPTRTAHSPQGWRRTGSNRRPPACKAGALPAELRPRNSPQTPSPICSSSCKPATATWTP